MRYLLLFVTCCTGLTSASAQMAEEKQADAMQLDAYHIMVDQEATSDTPFTYTTFQEAAAHLGDSATVYFRPGVYWIDDPDDPAIREGKDGREPFGMVVRCKHLRLIGLGDTPHDVVLASQRGQTQGAIGNFTMFDFWCHKLKVVNMTLGNYCNVDLVYPRNSRLNRQKRSAAITQAHVGYVHGDSLVAERVRFVSRLNLNPLNGANCSYYEDCHFECTDDALNGTAVYRHCDFDLYGQKPFWSTFGKGAMFIDCDFNVKGENREMYFCKQGGPVTVIDCRYHAPSDSIYIGWAPYPQPWLRCYQQNFTFNGHGYQIGIRQPQNTIVLPDTVHLFSQGAPYLNISRHEAELRTGEAPLALACSDSEPVKWRVTNYYEPYVSLTPIGKDSVLVTPTNPGGKTVCFCVMASTPDGREAACHLTVHPRLLPAPSFLQKPTLRLEKEVVRLCYDLDLQDRYDESTVIWLRDDIPVSVGKANPLAMNYPEYKLSDADNGHRLSALIIPKLHGSLTGDTIRVDAPKVIKHQKKSKYLDTDFHDIPCQWQSQVLPGYWTVDGHKPADTAEFPWTFDRSKPMWEYGEGFNGAVGMGLLQAQRGARLMYTPVEERCGDMSLTLQVDPTKTAGQGFGSATGQYMDVCLKFDTRTLTGYGLRIIRTVKHAKAVDFLLVHYDQGKVTPLTAPVTATCYRTGCVISLQQTGRRLVAHVESATPQPAGSSLPHTVDLQADVVPNHHGGIHIQHTGSCGESTTMLHQLHVTWDAQ